MRRCSLDQPRSRGWQSRVPSACGVCSFKDSLPGRIDPLACDTRILCDRTQPGTREASELIGVFILFACVTEMLSGCKNPC